MLAFEDANPVVGVDGVEFSPQVHELAIVEIGVTNRSEIRKLHVTSGFGGEGKACGVGNHASHATST